MELGARRAKAVRTYLAHLDGKFKLKAVSYGKARPVCSEATDACYGVNRRAQMSQKM
jgi:peptidoglycan-associated lipoprotein